MTTESAPPAAGRQTLNATVPLRLLVDHVGLLASNMLALNAPGIACSQRTSALVEWADLGNAIISASTETSWHSKRKGVLRFTIKLARVNGQLPRAFAPQLAKRLNTHFKNEKFASSPDKSIEDRYVITGEVHYPVARR